MFYQGTKRLPGFQKSGSIFATSDGLDGRVGVVNSGKGLTEFEQRKKHKFEISESP